MTKYCAKCGKALPEGSEVCPDCGPAGREGEAALFTRMTAETEVWKTPEPVKKKRVRVKLPKLNAKTAVLGCATVLLAAAAVILIILTQPAARVTRKLHQGEIEKAYTIFWSSAALTSGERNEKVDSAIMEAARSLCDQYACHALDADTAASKLSMLGGFGEGAADMLQDLYAEFRSYNGSQENMAAAEGLFEAEDYLSAREEYLKVLDTDTDYARAQERAEECLVRYGEKIGADAAALMEQKDYSAAMKLLEEGNSTLYGYDTFSKVIDDTLQSCREDYESYVLAEAGKLAEEKEYVAAADLIRAAAADFDDDVDSFAETLETYLVQAEEKLIAEAAERAGEQFDAGEYAAAFTELEQARASVTESKALADEHITAMEQRFAEETVAAAREQFGGVRTELSAAIEILDGALEIRELEELKACREDLARYLPLRLSEAEFSEKDKTVFRNSGAFESLDGTQYGAGWLWGEDGAEITFSVKGAYDEFYCAFAVRRDDNANANGWFEVWCDGEQVLKSQKLFHYQKEPQYHQIDISGCQELKLVFHCDYNASTAADGYCYHGLCDANLTKTIPENW